MADQANSGTGKKKNRNKNRNKNKGKSGRQDGGEHEKPDSSPNSESLVPASTGVVPAAHAVAVKNAPVVAKEVCLEMNGHAPEPKKSEEPDHGVLDCLIMELKDNPYISSWCELQDAEVRYHQSQAATEVDGLAAYANSGANAELVKKMKDLEIENKAMKRTTGELQKIIKKLEERVSLLEKGSGGSGTAKTAVPNGAEAKAEDGDDDIDLFGSDSDSEDDAEKAKVREERLKAYHEKKAKKPAVIAKTSVLLDIKPWDDETDMTAMLNCAKSIEKDGLVWGASKLVPVGYGINKWQLLCVVEDEKVSVEELCEQIAEFEDYVQSVDVAAMNKI